MDRGRFGSAIEEMRRRVDALAAVSGSAAGERAALAAELRDALEELRAAEAELQRQDEELVRAVTAAEVQRERYQLIFDLMPTPYFLLDRNGIVLEVNRAARALLDYVAPSLVGIPLAAMMTRGKKAFRGWLAAARAGHRNRIDDLEIELRRRGGTVVPVALTVAAAHDERGELTALRAVAVDIRERKRAEVATLVASTARAADAAKDDFLATLSHELRTPLNALLGWTQILRNDGLGGEHARPALESIERNAFHLNRLVSDLLDVSQITRGKLAFDMRACDPARVIADAIDAIWPAVAKRGLHLRAAIGETHVVRGDPARLQQAVVNLLSNAVKFSRAGGTIDLSVQRVSDQLRVVVRDDGEGIAPDFLPHVFDRFRQGRTTPDSAHPGLGLGLAIVLEVATGHGGRVWAESAGHGWGATFTMTIPLLAPDLRETPAVAASAGAVDATSLRGLHLLAVSPNGTSVGETLATAGAEVETAHSLSDALERARDSRPDALVVDADPSRLAAALLLARRVEEAFDGRLPVVICAPVLAPAGWEAVEAALQVHVATPSDASALLPLVGTVARLGGSTMTAH
jgi:PAS domain S-box-containing protein